MSINQPSEIPGKINNVNQTTNQLRSTSDQTVARAAAHIPAT